jgi:type I restriction enzyme R subunit
MYRFTEAELEKACMEWFEELGYEYRFGPDISPEGDYPERKSYSDVILDDRLKSALQRINRHVPSEALGEALRKLKVPQSPSLLINNKEFQRMITDGIDVSYRLKDGAIKYDKVWLLCVCFKHAPPGLPWHPENILCCVFVPVLRVGVLFL